MSCVCQGNMSVVCGSEISLWCMDQRAISVVYVSEISVVCDISVVCGSDRDISVVYVHGWAISVMRDLSVVCVSVRDICGVSEICLWCMGQRGISVAYVWVKLTYMLCVWHISVVYGSDRHLCDVCVWVKYFCMCLRDLFGVWVGDVSLWCICVSEISVCVCQWEISVVSVR